MSMLMETLEQINSCLKDGGVFIANYPASPRKMEMGAAKLKSIICNKIGLDLLTISGITSAPLFCFIKVEKRQGILSESA